MVDREKRGQTSVTGNLAATPERGTLKSGRPYSRFRVIDNERVFDQEQQQWVDGERKNYDVAVFNERLSKRVLQSLSQGDRVTVRGEYQVSPYINRNTGEPGLNRQIAARDVSLSMFDDRFESGVGPEVDEELVAEVEADRRADNRERFLFERYQNELRTDPEALAEHEQRLETDPEFKVAYEAHEAKFGDGKAPLSGLGASAASGPSQEVGTRDSAAEYLAWVDREVPWVESPGQTDRSISDRIPVEALEEDPQLVQEVYSAVPVADAAYWSDARQNVAASFVRDGGAVSDARVDAEVAAQIAEYYPAADVAERIQGNRQVQLEQFVQTEMVQGVDDPITIAPQGQQEQWREVKESIYTRRQETGLSVADDDVNAEFADRVMQRYSPQRVAEFVVEHEQSTVDQANAASQAADRVEADVSSASTGASGELPDRAPLSGPGTSAPPGPPQETATVQFGDPTPEQRREVAERQQRAAQSWNGGQAPRMERGQGVQPEHLMAQQLNQLPPRPGFNGPGM